MNLYNPRTFLVLCVTVLFIIHLTFWNFSEHKTEYSFVVTIPKAYDPNFTDEDFLKYSQNGNLIPVAEMKKRNLQLPNDCGILFVSLEKNEKLTINSQQFGSLENTIPLTQKLTETFINRENNSVYEANSNKIAKTVRIKFPLSTKYGDVVKVIDAVKASGAEPIVLQIDELPN